MSAKLILRIASLFALLFSVGHLMGGLKNWSPMGVSPVLKAMTDIHFDVMGQSRSYMDFYLGFGWSIGVELLLQAALLWQMASIAGEDVRKVRPMIVAFAIATLVSGVIAWRFLFPVPAVFSGALLVILVAAYLASRAPARPGKPA